MGRAVGQQTPPCGDQPRNTCRCGREGPGKGARPLPPAGREGPVTEATLVHAPGKEERPGSPSVNVSLPLGWRLRDPKREVGDGRRVVGGEASKPADSGAFTLVCGRRCSELRPRDPAGGCSPAQPGPSGHPGSSAGPESQRLVCWRVLSFSGLFSSNAKGGVRQSLASSCSKPLRLEDKSLSQGFSEQ